MQKKNTKMKKGRHTETGHPKKQPQNEVWKDVITDQIEIEESKVNIKDL